MQCVSHCPGLAIFGYDTRKQTLFLPIEYEIEEGEPVWLVDDNAQKLGEGVDLTDDNEASKDQLLDWLDFWAPGNHDDRTIAILYEGEDNNPTEKNTAEDQTLEKESDEQ